MPGRVARAVERLNEVVGRAASWLLLLMVALGALNAVARYGGRWAGVNLSSNALLEAQWYLFAAVFLLAAPATLAADRHVRVDVLYGRLTPRGQAAIDVAGTLLFLLPLCAFAVAASWPSVRDSWAILEQSSDPGGLPRYPVKTLVPVAFTLLALQGLAQLPPRIAALREFSSGGPTLKFSSGGPTPGSPSAGPTPRSP
jgi:TRAP-type mannitol/chloroaromatic compound transport system permease small subunit